MNKDVILDEIQRVRDELIARHGGLDGWIDHLQEMDRQRARKAIKRPKKKSATSAEKSRTGSTKSRTGRIVK